MGKPWWYKVGRYNITDIAYSTAKPNWKLVFTVVL